MTRPTYCVYCKRVLVLKYLPLGLKQPTSNQSTSYVCYTAQCNANISVSKKGIIFYFKLLHSFYYLSADLINSTLLQIGN